VDAPSSRRRKWARESLLCMHELLAADIRSSSLGAPAVASSELASSSVTSWRAIAELQPCSLSFLACLCSPIGSATSSW